MDINEVSYKSIIENLHDGLYFVDKNRKITYWNKAAERISGFSSKEVVGRECSDNILTHVDADGNNLCEGMCPLAQSLIDGKARETDVYMHHKKGFRIPVSVRVGVLRNFKGKIIGAVELFTDLSNRSASRLRVKELEKIALIDKLTQLANRNYVETELKTRIEEKNLYNIPFANFIIVPTGGL